MYYISCLFIVKIEVVEALSSQLIFHKLSTICPWLVIGTSAKTLPMRHHSFTALFYSSECGLCGVQYSDGFSLSADVVLDNRLYTVSPLRSPDTTVL